MQSFYFITKNSVIVIIIHEDMESALSELNPIKTNSQINIGKRSNL